MQHKLLRIGSVVELTGLSKASIYKLMKEQKFPQNIKISERCVGWNSEDVQNWIEKKILEGVKQ